MGALPLITGPLTPLEVTGLTLTARADDLASQVRLLYGYRADTGDYTRTLIRATVEAPYGPREQVIESKWLRAARDADDLARRTLERLAGLRFTAQFTTTAALAPGDRVTLQHPLIPGGSGTVTVLAVADNLQRGERTVSGDLRWGAPPATRLVSTSRQFVAGAGGALEVAYDQGVLTLTILDDQARPAPGARVSLDGGNAQTTDARGQVRFTGVAPGAHRVAVQLAGYEPLELEITV